MSIDHRVDALPFRLLPFHVRILPVALTKLEAAFLRDNRSFSSFVAAPHSRSSVPRIRARDDSDLACQSRNPHAYLTTK
jgi:hypothetical protein